MISTITLPSGWIFEATTDYKVCFSVSGGFLLVAGLISCGVDILKRRQQAAQSEAVIYHNAHKSLVSSFI